MNKPGAADFADETLGALDGCGIERELPFRWPCVSDLGDNAGGQRVHGMGV